MKLAAISGQVVIIKPFRVVLVVVHTSAVAYVGCKQVVPSSEAAAVASEDCNP